MAAASKNSDSSLSVLIIGNSALAQETAAILGRKRFYCVLESQPFIPKPEHHFNFILALSDDDVDNLLMCRIGKNYFHTSKTICICNDRRNERLFQVEEVDFFPREEITANEIEQYMLKKEETRA